MRSASVLLLLFLGACAPIPVNRASVGSDADGVEPSDDAEPPSATVDGPAPAPPVDARPADPDASPPPPDLAPPPDKGPAPTLSNLSVKDTANAARWALQKNLRAGDTAFGDRTYMFATVSDGLVGRPWIRPANLSKAYQMDPLATFDMSTPGLVMIGLDTRATMPTWLMSWDVSPETLTYVDVKNATVTHKILSKSFPAGTVSLGPIVCPTQSCNTYVIVVGPPP